MKYSIMGEPHAFQAACRRQGGYLVTPKIHVWNTVSCPGCLCSAIDHEDLVNVFRRA